MVRIKARCDDNCDCQTRIIAKYTTSRDNPGRIDESGTLVGLPNEFRSTYTYEGFMELQQGCSNPCCTPSVGCEDDLSWP